MFPFALKSVPSIVAVLLASLMLCPLAEAAPKKKGSSRAKSARITKRRAAKHRTHRRTASKPRRVEEAPRKSEDASNRETTQEEPASKTATTAGGTTTEAPATAATTAATAAAAGALHQETSPISENGVEPYALFLQKLEEQVEGDSLDFCPAMQTVLSATNDEFAVADWMARAAESGNSAALYYLAGRKLTSVPADKLQEPEIKEAYQRARRAAEAGFEPAMLDVSLCLRYGIGTQKDEAAADRWLLQACKSGNFDMRFKWLQLTNRLTKFEDGGRTEVKSELDRGNHHVLYYLSAFAPDSATQLEWLRKAAEKGNPSALYSLSSLSSRLNPKDSYTLLQEAVKKHNPEAMFVLGQTLLGDEPGNPYVKEAGITLDEASGLHLLRLASMLDNAPANVVLGNLYYDGGHGLPKNHERAYQHYAQAQKSRHAAAAAAQGIMLLKGDGVAQDVAQGTRLLNLAANSGYGYAAILLAYAQYEGIGVPADARKAAEFLNDAAVMGQPAAYVYLAYITAKGGHNLKADPKLAENYVRMAALDMGDKAQQLYDELMKAGKWEPHP